MRPRTQVRQLVGMLHEMKSEQLPESLVEEFGQRGQQSGILVAEVLGLIEDAEVKPEQEQQGVQKREHQERGSFYTRVHVLRNARGSPRSRAKLL